MVGAAPASLDQPQEGVGDADVLLSGILLSFCASHLFVGHGNESVFGQLPQYVEVRPHVHLAAHKHHFGTGTELLRLPLPLCGKSMRSFITCLLGHTSSSEITSLQIPASPGMFFRGFFGQ